MDSRLAWVVVALAAVGCAEGSTFGAGGDSSDGPNTGGDSSDGAGSADGGGSSDGAGSSDGGGTPNACGDGSIDPGEACDGTDLGTESCATQEFAGGTLVCTAACELDTSGCVETLCNNGVIDEGEACDGPNLGTETCAANGFAGGTLLCTADTCQLDTGICKPPMAEGFESGGLPAGFTSSGNANWLTDSSTPYLGVYSARSGDIADYGVSSVAVTVQFDTAGSISFYHFESTESGYDYLEFYIDGALQGEWSGSTSWTQATYPVAAGSHQMMWTYSKDVSLSSGTDSVYVDEITAVNGFVP
jgi:hypothetical protein